MNHITSKFNLPDSSINFIFNILDPKIVTPKINPYFFLFSLPPNMAVDAIKLGPQNPQQEQPKIVGLLKNRSHEPTC